jgi:flagellar biosynthesis protein FlhA
MDGASKFVKGDAIAGILILLINIIGGLLIGVMQHQMPWGQALATYTLLTIGDGIVTQVPALVIAVGTGIIVTRSASDTNLSHEVLRQITSHPKTLLLVSAALGGLVLLPGIPLLPALMLLAGALAMAALAYKAAQRREAGEAGSGEKGEASNARQSDDAYASLAVEPVEVQMGASWASVVQQPEGLLMDRLAAFRKQYAQELGMVLPKVRFRDSSKLGANRYEIAVDGVTVARGEARIQQWLAIHPSGDVRSIPGEATHDPTYGLPALWIDAAHKDAAQAAKFTLVDGTTVFMTHLTEVLRREAATLLTRVEIDRLFERVRQSRPGLVEELIPTVLSISDVQKVLQNLLREKVSIRHLEAILETLVDAGRGTKDAAVLTELVRHRLGHAICQDLLGEAAALHVMTLDPMVESRFMQSLQSAQAPAQPLALEPKLAEQFMSRIIEQAERMMKSNLLPVLLCSPDLRRHVRALCERVMPHLRVLSMTEIPQTIELKSYGVVSL